MSRRRWFDWHSQVGVLAGLLLFVVCWSGTVATLSHEIDALLNPAKRVVPAETRASWGEIIDAAQRAHPGATPRWASAPLYPTFAAEVVMATPEGPSLRVFVDPYRGAVTGTTTYFNVQRFFRSFHMSLFDWGGTMAGYYVVCALSLVLLASFVTSLVFYKRWWRGFFTLKTANGARVFWADSHKLVGVWSLWFVLLMAITGGWYLFEAARYQIDPDGSAGQFGVPDVPPVDTAINSAEIDALVAVAQRTHPELEIRGVSLYDDGLLSVDGQSVHWLVRDRANAVHVARASGEVVLDQRADQLNAYWRWSDTADPLHFGDFGGLATKLLWFVFGLGLSALSLTGAYLHLQRIIARGADRVAVTRRSRRIATVMVLAVLAWSVGGGWAEISDYGVDGYGGLFSLTPVGVWVFLAAWLLVTVGVLVVWVRKLG